MYQAPLKDLHFVLDELLGGNALSALPRYAEYSAELAGSVLSEAARFAEQELAPINRLGDERGARFSDSMVQLPPEFKRAYQRFVDGGWPQLAVAAEHGGQGAPLALAVACDEMWYGANIGFMLCPLLGRAAVEALTFAATPALQQQLLPALVSGAWTGTMNLTESQAGSDLAAIRTQARPDGRRFRLRGQKIFITYGEHDLTDNIVHLVLARIDGAPAGVKGISLFAVPKRLLNSDGSIGERNDVRCLSIEHKLGMHVSPTCVMVYGERDGAVGDLIGEPNRGLEYMFIMMNAARLAVGVQGQALAELALQQARSWAHTRVQGRVPGVRSETPVSIDQHPDVRRLLLNMRANVEAMRALALYAALQLDLARSLVDETQRAAALARAELLIPIVKGWNTETAIDVVSRGLQVHGGMGYIEETGVAQTLRDVRITSIYEGTTAIQANDLLGRKLGRDRGAAMAALLADLLRELNDLRGSAPALRSIRNAAIESITVLRDATESLLPQIQEAPLRAYGVAVPYLMLCGRVLGGALMARAAGIAAQRLDAAAGDTDFYRSKLQTARFYAEFLLAEVWSAVRVIRNGGASVADADPALL